jgi:hypothetical protein
MFAMLSIDACYVPIDADNWSQDGLQPTQNILQCPILIATCDIDITAPSPTDAHDIALYEDENSKTL